MAGLAVQNSQNGRGGEQSSASDHSPYSAPPPNPWAPHVQCMQITKLCVWGGSGLCVWCEMVGAPYPPEPAGTNTGLQSTPTQYASALEQQAAKGLAARPAGKGGNIKAKASNLPWLAPLLHSMAWHMTRDERRERYTVQQAKNHAFYLPSLLHASSSSLCFFSLFVLVVLSWRVHAPYPPPPLLSSRVLIKNPFFKRIVLFNH